jgi:hypothetical protein
VLLAAGKTDEAISRFQASIDLEPTYFYAHIFWAVHICKLARSRKQLLPLNAPATLRERT